MLFRSTVTKELEDVTLASADPTLLALAIDNLIENALRHNHDDGTIHVTVGKTGDSSWVEISNSGPVMSEKEAARLVEPFNRGQNTRTSGEGRNLGLGLTLVQSITDSLGGSLTLRPIPTGGLIARLRFGSAQE